MRTTNNMLVNNMINYIGNNLERMDKYQNQMATGKKISVPSDDPIIAARALKLRTDVSEIEQYQRNLKDAQSWMDVTESALSNIDDVIQRARELAVQGASSTSTPTDNQKIAAEVTQLKGQLVNIANTTYAGRYIFSGFKTDSKLIDENTDNFSIDVSNSENIKCEIGVGDNININVLGGDLFNGGNSATAGQQGQLMQHFNTFINNLNNGTSSSISASIADMDSDMNNLLRIRADVGARSNRVDLTTNRMDNDNITFTKLMSENEDVDMSETIMNLQNEENVYKASLAGGAKIIQPTLIDFLR